MVVARGSLRRLGRLGVHLVAAMRSRPERVVELVISLMLADNAFDALCNLLSPCLQLPTGATPRLLTEGCACKGTSSMHSS